MTYIPPREMELMVRLTGYDSDTIESALSGEMDTWDVNKIINYRMEERAAIVAWLRALAIQEEDGGIGEIAQDIEDGWHFKW